MSLEEKILELRKEKYSSVKINKIINLLKVVLVDGETNLYEIEKQVPITIATIKKYMLEKEEFLKYITEKEYNLFLSKMTKILEEETNKKEREKFVNVAKIIDEIFNTRYRLQDICANNFFTTCNFRKLLTETNYVDENFGIGVSAKVQAKIDQNGKDRMRAPRDMFLVQDRFHVFVAKKEITFLNEFDYRRLAYASDYLCSGANLEYVMKKREASIDAVIRNLSDKKLEKILKEEHYENLKRYVEIEKLILSNDLSKKKEVLFNFVECLYEKNLNKEEVMEMLKLPECLFNKYLLELIKLPYFNKEIKKDAKALLNIEEEKKVK